MTTLEELNRPTPWLELEVLMGKDGHTKASLARASDYSHQYVGLLVRGLRRPNPTVIARFAEVLNVPKSVLEPRNTVSDAA